MSKQKKCDHLKTKKMQNYRNEIRIDIVCVSCDKIVRFYYKRVVPKKCNSCGRYLTDEETLAKECSTCGDLSARAIPRVRHGILKDPFEPHQGRIIRKRLP